MRAMPWPFDSVGLELSTSCPAKMSEILPTPCTVTPAARMRCRWFGRGGSSEKSWRRGVRTNEPGSPSNGRAITRPTASSPVSISRAVRQAAYSSSSGTVCSCAATWNTLSADVYTIQSPVRWCCSPSRSMISVPEAATFPITPRPVASLKRSISCLRKAVGEGRERALGDDAHHLPVPGGGVHSEAALDQPAPDGRGVRARRAPGQRQHVAQPQLLQRRQLEAADRLGHVPERVRPGRAEPVGVGQVADADGVQHDHAGSGHPGQSR